METGFYEWGNSNNQTLVFLHGLGSAGLSFGELAQLLKNKFHIISLDLPGHGGKPSLQQEEHYWPSSVAGRLNNWINSLELNDIFLVGHSWGAHLALYVAGLFPKAIKGLILLDGGYFQEDAFDESLKQQLENTHAFIETVRFTSREEFLESEKSNSPRWSDEIELGCLAQVTEVNDEIRLAVSPFTAKSVVKGIYYEPTREIFQRVQSPVMLMRSTLPLEVEDKRNEAIECMIKAMPQAEVQVI